MLIAKETGEEFKIEFDSNVTAERIVKHLRLSHDRPNARWIEPADAHDGTALVVAGGPSLALTLQSIKSHQANGAKLFALNKSPYFLIRHGIIPDAHVLLDAAPFVTDYVHRQVRMERYYSSQCDPAVLDLAGDELILWDPFIEGICEAVPEAKGPFIGGGTTVGTRAIGLCYMLGYRQIHVYGLDSSYDGADGHAYAQSDYMTMLDVTFQNKKYRTPPQLLAQAQEFQNLLPEILGQGVELHIHGEGLIPDIAASFASSTN